MIHISPEELTKRVRGYYASQIVYSQLFHEHVIMISRLDDGSFRSWAIDPLNESHLEGGTHSTLSDALKEIEHCTFRHHLEVIEFISDGVTLEVVELN